MMVFDWSDTEQYKLRYTETFCSFRALENKEIVNFIKIIMYLQYSVSSHPISSYPGCDMVSNDELDSSNKISIGVHLTRIEPTNSPWLK